MTTQTVTDLRFLGDWGLWLTLLLAVVLAGAAAALYWRETRRHVGNQRWFLPALRALVVFLLVLMLAGPVLRHRRTIGELARVLVFVDASKSSGLTDDAMEPARKLRVARRYGWFDADVLKTNILGVAPNAETVSNAVLAAVTKFDSAPRWQRMEQLLLDDRDGLVPQLAKKHNVEVWLLNGPAAQLFWSGTSRLELPRKFATKPEADQTDLSTAIAARMNQHQTERAAVVLVSDGQHNHGSSPLATAKSASGRNIPLFTVGVGAVERPPDLAVLGVTAPESVFFEDRVRGEISLKDDMPAGQSFVLKIEEGDQTLWEKTLTTERSNRRTVEFDFSIKELVAGKKLQLPNAEYTSFSLELQARLVPLTGEKDPTNNVAVFRSRAMTQKRKLLLLDGRPRWEFRYLRNTFERNPQWEVNALVAGTAVLDEWERGDKPGQFPTSREVLFAYDLIGFGEVPPALLRPAELEWIKDFVDQRGGGLFFIDGQRRLLSAYAAGPLGGLFPIDWRDNAPKETPARLQLTDRGAAFGPLRLTGDNAANAALWKKLPPPHWLATTKARPGAETLVEAVVGDQKAPAIVVQQVGAGKVLYLGFDETWRWRYDVADKYQDAFWHQIATAIMEPAYAAQNKHIALDAGAANYAAGTAVEIRVRLRDEQGRTLTAGQPQAIVSRAGKKVASLPLTALAGGAFRGQTAALGPGDYEVRGETGRLVPATADMPVSFHVQRPGGDASSELAELTGNEELLKQMAQASGRGEFFREEDADKLLAQLEPLSHGRIEESETVLWQSWYWFIPVILLLTVEWIIRKRTGLI